MKIPKLELGDRIILPQIVQVDNSNRLQDILLQHIGEEGLEQLEDNSRRYSQRCSELKEMGINPLPRRLCLHPDIRAIEDGSLQLSGSIYVHTDHVSNAPIIGARIDGGYIVIDR